MPPFIYFECEALLPLVRAPIKFDIAKQRYNPLKEAKTHFVSPTDVESETENWKYNRNSDFLRYSLIKLSN